MVVGLGVGQLGLVVVVARFGEHDPFVADVDTDAEDGGDVLPEEMLLLEGSTIDDIEVHLHALELQLVAYGDIVDVLARLVFNQVG